MTLNGLQHIDFFYHCTLLCQENLGFLRLIYLTCRLSSNLQLHSETNRVSDKNSCEKNRSSGQIHDYLKVRSKSNGIYVT
ncbi:hypothetical protein TNCV_3085921 [Trichonephila clavipes]|nr:hypothetical protein TNCV_3085921 [Trichonephila clavipes]